MDINEIVRLDRSDPEHGDLFVRTILWLCILAFILGSTALMAHNISTIAPPEPQWWLEFEKMIGVTW